MRELVHQMVTRLDLRFGRNQQGRKTVHPFAEGVHLRPDPVLYRFVNRGRPVQDKSVHPPRGSEASGVRQCP